MMAERSNAPSWKGGESETWLLGFESLSRRQFLFSVVRDCRIGTAAAFFVAHFAGSNPVTGHHFGSVANVGLWATLIKS